MVYDISDNIILTGTVGSHSYGTATPASDYDFMSVVIASPDVYLDLSSWGSAGTKKDQYQDPIKGDVEHQYFEIKKFMSMCEGMNPNAIPLLWLEPQHYEVMTPQGALLVKNRNLFNSKRAYHTFSGYAHGQLRAMGGVFNDAEEPNKLLKAGHEKFQRWADGMIDLMRRIRDGKEVLPEEAAEIYHYDEGWLNSLIALRTHSKEECKRIKDGPITGRMGKKRKELREKFGYDVKFAFHTIRLMKMCVEFLTHPEEGVKVYRKPIDGDFLYSIREGAFKEEEIKTMADELFAEAKEALKSSPLPDNPDSEAIHNLTMDLIRFTLV